MTLGYMHSFERDLIWASQPPCISVLNVLPTTILVYQNVFYINCAWRLLWLNLQHLSKPAQYANLSKIGQIQLCTYKAITIMQIYVLTPYPVQNIIRIHWNGFRQTDGSNLGNVWEGVLEIDVIYRISEHTLHTHTCIYIRLHAYITCAWPSFNV